MARALWPAIGVSVYAVVLRASRCSSTAASKSDEAAGCASSVHATKAALRAWRASALLWRPWGLEGSTASKGSEVVAVCA